MNYQYLKSIRSLFSAILMCIIYILLHSTFQGMAQGCITGVSSFASIISPLLFTPLTG